VQVNEGGNDQDRQWRREMEKLQQAVLLQFLAQGIAIDAENFCCL